MTVSKITRQLTKQLHRVTWSKERMHVRCVHPVTLTDYFGRMVAGHNHHKNSAASDEDDEWVEGTN